MSDKDILEKQIVDLDRLLENARDAQTDWEVDPWRCSRLQHLADQALLQLLRNLIQRETNVTCQPATGRLESQ